MVRFIYIAVLIAVASLTYSEAQDFSIEQCNGGLNDKWERSNHCDPTCEWRNQCFHYYRSSHCRCQNGTFRNNDGLCVSPSDCPILDEPCRGGPNDYLILDVDLHEPTCDRPYIGIVLLNMSESGLLESRKDCRCQFGTVRREDGRCVYLKDCPYSRIRDHKCLGGPDDRWEVPHDGIYEKKCGKYTHGTMIRVTPNGTCRCESGTKRRHDGACVRPSECDLPFNLN